MRPQIVKIFVYLLCALASTTFFGAPLQVANEPPPPGSQRTPGPELPIDENVFILVGVAIIFGVYVAYKRHKATQKAL